MDPQQPQTTAEAQPPAGQPDPNGAPQFDPNFAAQMSDPEAMAGIVPGQPFIPDPNVAGMYISDPSMMAPLMMGDGQMPLQQAKTVSAGKPHIHSRACPSPKLPKLMLPLDDVALYDRQIRLWGMAAQAKIQNANILLITMRALANEVAKNLVLAGVASLTILDHAPVTEADLGAQFLLSDGSTDGGQSRVGQNRAEAAAPALRRLNPRVRVHVDTEQVESKGPSYFAAYDMVVATDLSPASFNLINIATRLNSRPFYAAGTHGLYGFIFSDLIEHDYVIERDASNVATQPHQETRTRSIVNVQTKKEGGKEIESVTKRELYSTWFLASDVAALPADYTSSKRRLSKVSPALSCLRALWEFTQIQPSGTPLPSTREDLKMFTQLATQKHKALSLPSETLKPEFLRSFLQNLGAEIAPIAAILGGQLAQDVINVLGQREQPIQNTVILDGNTMEAPVYALHPEGNIGANLLDIPTNGSVNPAGGVPGVMMNMPMDASGMPMMPQNGFPVDPNGGAFAQNGMGMPDIVQQMPPPQHQQDGQAPVPVQQPPSQHPVSAPEQPPQQPSAVPAPAPAEAASQEPPAPAS